MATVCVDCGRRKKTNVGERCRSCTTRERNRTTGRNQTVLTAQEATLSDNARHLAASRKRRTKA